MNTELKNQITTCIQNYSGNGDKESITEYTQEILNILTNEMRNDFEFYNTTDFFSRSTSLSYIDRKYTELDKICGSLSTETI